MNSMISRSRLLSAAICGALLAACNAVEDVQEEPYVELPSQSVVLQGSITGLGTRRPVILQYNGQDVCIDTTVSPNLTGVPCRFFGTLGQTTSTFSFGSLPAGTPYNVIVKTQPYGKVCTVANGSGTLGVTSGGITVSCVNDPAVPRFTVSGTIAPAVRDAPGAKVILTTEEGVLEFPAAGQSTFSFPNAIFNSQTNLPIFKYFVTATNTVGDTVNNCNVTAGSNEIFNSAGEDTSVPPTGAVTNVAVTACSFTVSAVVAYQAASGQPTLAMPAGGMEVALKLSRTGENVQTVPVNSFATVTFPGVLSNRDAIYELAVTRQPAGMTCVIGSSSQYQWGSAVLLLNPLDASRTPNHGWIISRNVRCRANPAGASRLLGTYRLSTIATAGTPPVTTTTETRNFLTFFDDGTYLYGHHATGAVCSTACGVEQGFYVYNTTTSTIAFNPTTDTNGASGLSTISGGAATATSLTNVVKTAGTNSRIAANFGTASWLLIEPDSSPGQMQGSWATDDHRRVWIFDASNYNGFHMGVNGLANAQDGCYNIEDLTAASGFYTRRGNATLTCVLGTGYFTLDVPSAGTTPRTPEGFVGKWPQSTSNADGRPSSPVNYLITAGAAGAPDTLRIRETVNGAETLDGVTPVSPEIVLHRMRAN